MYGMRFNIVRIEPTFYATGTYVWYDAYMCAYECMMTGKLHLFIYACVRVYS